MRDTWDKVGPFKLFDQHEDEITEDVVNLSNEVHVPVFVVEPTILFWWLISIWVKKGFLTTTEIIYRQATARPSKLRMTVVCRR